MSYFGIGVYNLKKDVNLGTLYRSAYNFGADFIFTIGRRYVRQSSDTVNSYKHIPLYNYDNFESFYRHIPYGCMLIGVECNGKQNLTKLSHPKNCIYLLGPEDGNIPKEILERCHHTIFIPTNNCLNVAVAGAVVMYDRICKGNQN